MSWLALNLLGPFSFSYQRPQHKSGKVRMKTAAIVLGRAVDKRMRAPPPSISSYLWAPFVISQRYEDMLGRVVKVTASQDIK